MSYQLIECPPHGTAHRSMRALSAVCRLASHPGGQPMCRPPSTCACRWITDCPPSELVLNTTRYPLAAIPSCLATSLAICSISAISAGDVTSFSDATCALGITSTCTGACGFTSLIAMHVASSVTIFAGISPLAIRQNRHFSVIPTLLHFLSTRLDRPRQGRERRAHHRERRHRRRLESQHRVTQAHHAEPRGHELFELRALHSTLGTDDDRDRLQESRPMLTCVRHRLGHQQPHRFARHVEHELRSLGRRRDRALDRRVGIRRRQPRTVRLPERTGHPGRDLLLERRPLAARVHALRPLEHHGPPARRRKLRGLFREPQHAIAIRDGKHEVHRRRYTVTGWTDLNMGRPSYAMQFPDVIGTEGTTNTFLDSFLRGNRDDQPRRSDGSILQALNLMNASLIENKLALTGATASPLMVASAPLNNTDAVNKLFLTILSRYPSASEMSTAIASLPTATGAARNSAIQDLAWALYNKVDFVFNY